MRKIYVRFKLFLENKYNKFLRSLFFLKNLSIYPHNNPINKKQKDHASSSFEIILGIPFLMGYLFPQPSQTNVPSMM